MGGGGGGDDENNDLFCINFILNVLQIYTYYTTK
jgi:hypothetical protein